MTKYRIRWTSKVTGATGHGKPIFATYEQASRVARELDDELMYHVVEKVEVDPVTES